MDEGKRDILSVLKMVILRIRIIVRLKIMHSGVLVFPS